MKVNQVYNILNTITQEMLGESVIVSEDLSNVVDVGKAFANLGSTAYENYVKKLHDVIGKMVFVDRPYTGRAPSLLMDGWEYGSILEKVRADLPEAEENESWELNDGTSYDPNVFTQPSVSAKFYNSKVTFEIPLSVTDRQVRSAFNSAGQLNAFYSMVYTAVENSMTNKLDGLIMRTLNSMIGETFYDMNNAGTYTGAGNTRAVNLLYAYNQIAATPLTVANCIYDPDFIRFASYTVKNVVGRVRDLSTLFNIGGTAKFTPDDKMKVIMLNEFKNAAEVYLYGGAGQFNVEDVRFPAVDTVSYWQGSGTGYALTDTAAINITTPSGHAVTPSGILAVVCDRDAVGVANLNRRVTTNYNPKAEFTNTWNKADAGYFADTDENFIVFYVAA